MLKMPGHHARNAFAQPVIVDKINTTLEDTMSDVAEKVTKIIVDQLGVNADEVKPEASFVEDLGADSLDLTELIMAMEEEFDIEIADDDAQKILKVQDAISYIENKK